MGELTVRPYPSSEFSGELQRLERFGLTKSVRLLSESLQQELHGMSKGLGRLLLGCC